MKVLIKGSEGNMGTRYRLICESLGHEVYRWDLSRRPQGKDYDRIIIATPTSLHLKDIAYFLDEGLPILCEKPLCKSVTKLSEFLLENPEARDYLQMVNQYAYYIKHGHYYGNGSSYEYYRHGGDGLYWDCINIIGMNEQHISIREDKTRYLCKINGYLLDRDDIDECYVSMIEDFLERPKPDIDYIVSSHLKVEAILNECFDWDTGKIV